MLAACVVFFRLSNVSTKQMKPGASLLKTAALRAGGHGSWVDITLAMLDISQLSDEMT